MTNTGDTNMEHLMRLLSEGKDDEADDYFNSLPETEQDDIIDKMGMMLDALADAAQSAADAMSGHIQAFADISKNMSKS